LLGTFLARRCEEEPQSPPPPPPSSAAAPLGALGRTQAACPEAVLRWALAFARRRRKSQPPPRSGCRRRRLLRSLRLLSLSQFLAGQLVALSGVVGKSQSPPPPPPSSAAALPQALGRTLSFSVPRWAPALRGVVRKSQSPPPPPPSPATAPPPRELWDATKQPAQKQSSAGPLPLRGVEGRAREPPPRSR
jgi:hypothetical protein